MVDVVALGLPPGVLLIVAAIPAVLLPHRLSQVVMMALPLLGLAHLLSMPAEFGYAIQIFDYMGDVRYLLRYAGCVEALDLSY